jgi:hypothetical protein
MDMKETLKAICNVQAAEAAALAIQSDVLRVLDRLFELRVGLVERFAPDGVKPAPMDTPA